MLMENINKLISNYDEWDLYNSFFLCNDIERLRKFLVKVELFKKVLNIPGDIVELGVFKGRFSEVLLKKTKPKLLYLIDPWYQYEAQWEWASGDKSTINALRNILRKFKKDIESGLVKLYVDSDIDILKRFQSNSLDWAYIDSSHEYEHTSIELGLLCQKIKKGGVITGDDWHPDPHHKHHGVYKAVQEFIDSGKINQGDTILMQSFGAGFTWGTMIITL